MKLAALNRPPVVLVTIFTIALLVVGFVIWNQSSVETKPDFTAFERVEDKKQAFVDFLRPRIEAANQNVRAERAHIAELRERHAADEFGDDECELIGSYAQRYEIDTAHSDEWCNEGEFVAQVFETLLRRADTVPVALALAQAAKESGWGTSRFAIDGHNYFGQHCYVEGCGEMPRRRAPGRQHEVAIFDSSWHSVEEYLRNLNTHPRYHALRAARQRLRREGEQLKGLTLAEHLQAYSERGAAYVKEIKSLIRRNDFE